MRHPEGGSPDHDLKVVEGNREDEQPPKLSGAALDRVCSLRVSDRERDYFNDAFLEDPKSAWPILLALFDRNFEKELPVDEESFSYKRNLEECKKLKQTAARLLSKKTIDNADPDTVQLLETASTLLALERRKAAWLEKEYNPVIYGRAMTAAKGEVNQFLMRQKNQHTLDDFRDLENVDVRLLDELNYLAAGHAPESMGEYSRGEIAIRIPPYFTDRDESTVFHTGVHEYMHAASDLTSERVGLHQHGKDPDFEELNEAVTEIATYSVMRTHLEKGKTPLVGERDQPLTLDRMSYAEYTIVVKQIFAKVPEQLFMDAMFSAEGLDLLKKKFTEAFGSEHALVEYGERLRDLYLPAAVRARKKDGAKVLHLSSHKKRKVQKET